MAAPKPPFIRLMSGFKISESGCWEWQGYKKRNGYGLIKVFGKMVSVHRYSYELHHGPIADGGLVLHSCDNKICINPAHLRQGTHAENMQDAKERGQMRSGSNHPMFGVTQKRPKQAKPVHVMGKEYESQKAAERALGLGSGTVRWWVHNRPSKAWHV